MNPKPWLDHYDRGVPATIIYPAKTVHSFLSDAAAHFPDQACTTFRDNQLTYRQMDRLTDKLAAGLLLLGVRKGDRVGVVLPNIPQFVIAFYGILKMGGIVVAMNPQYKIGELEFQVANAGVKTLIGLKASSDLLQQLKERTGLGRLIMTDVDDAFKLRDLLNKMDQSKDSEAQDFMGIIAHASQPLPKLDIFSQDAAVFQYSGGTTGEPKAAIGTHKNLVANTLQFRNWLIGLEDGKETVLAAIPLFHVYGMVIAMSLGVALGANLVLAANSRDVNDLLNNIERYHVTLFPGVPQIYHLINQSPAVRAGKYKLDSIKACISGSAPLHKETKEAFEASTGGKVMEGYGLSEAPTATHCNPMFGENRIGSIGLPLPDVECRIVSLDGADRDLSVGEPGELILRGPQVMQGYFNLPQETEIALKNGWLHTGDIARMDAEGYFYLVDRKKELIKVSGFQVWPREIEDVLMTHPKVLEAGVAGIPDELHGEAAKAWIVLKAGMTATSEEMKAWCTQRLVKYKVPVQIEFLSALPRTSVGKLLRRELVRMHLENKKTPPVT
ncbi:MAG TPA: long-chain fatty acid--CoA ligase [Longilinea sp.]|nr:long-chain fatty acid--CoA ligase [Longilinea sp.]